MKKLRVFYEGWGLMLMDQLFRKAGRLALGLSPLDRLAFIGFRAMGALTFEPADPFALSAEDVELSGRCSMWCLTTVTTTPRTSLFGCLNTEPGT